VKKRSGELIALLCALLLLLTEVFQLYAVAARPYSMVVACVAFAAVCHQGAPSRVWMVLLALSLALAQSIHYY
jgi:4-amino-4-deoxy-L-arabinose transferase-like glycosyltransferase